MTFRFAQNFKEIFHKGSQLIFPYVREICFRINTWITFVGATVDFAALSKFLLVGR